MKKEYEIPVGRIYSIKQARLEIGFKLPPKGFINWLIDCGYLLSKCEVNPIYERAKILLMRPHDGGRCGKIFFSEWGIKELKMRYQEQINNLKNNDNGK